MKSHDPILSRFSTATVRMMNSITKRQAQTLNMLLKMGEARKERRRRFDNFPSIGKTISKTKSYELIEMMI